MTTRAQSALVLGRGVTGLSTAIRLGEAGWDVSVWSPVAERDTTSAVAAAVWYPYAVYPRDRVTAWGETTRRELERLARETPESGVRLAHVRELRRKQVPDPWWADAVPTLRRCQPGELWPPYTDGFAFEAPVADITRYLGYLHGRAIAAGVRIEQRSATSLADALMASPLVVNCAGLAAGALAGDTTMFPIRGQVVRTTNPGIDRVLIDEDNPGGITYVVPREHDCVLGGTSEPDHWDTTPDATTAEHIVSRCITLEPRLAEARVLEHRVGLRPGRAAIRLERERHVAGVCIHNYGHGGAGITLSWGCADEVAKLAVRDD